MDHNIAICMVLTPDRRLPAVSFFTYGGLMKTIWRGLTTLPALAPLAAARSV